MKINKNRMVEQMENLAQFGNHQEMGITRFAFTQEYEEARCYVKKCMEEAGLETHIDAVGNLIGVYMGNKRGKIFVGSHIDTVKCGGKYDGSIGVIGAIEAVRTLHENQIRLEKDIYVCAYVDEEFTSLGSKAIAGAKVEEDSIHKLILNGYQEEDVKKCRFELEQQDIALELHIEQGKMLEEKNINIGIVDAIAASYKYAGVVKGTAGHAGTLQMYQREDAFVKMSEYTLAFNQMVCEYEQLVGTIGKIEVTPGARNIVPGKVDFLMEMRSPNEKDMLEVEKKLEEKFGDKVELIRTEEYKIVEMDVEINQKIEKICKDMNMSFMHMNSGAGHDIQSFNERAKCGLIFIPSVGGLSHCPEEYTSWEDCERGINVLMHLIRKAGEE